MHPIFLKNSNYDKMEEKTEEINRDTLGFLPYSQPNQIETQEEDKDN